MPQMTVYACVTPVGLFDGVCAILFDREIYALTGDGDKPLLPSEKLRSHCHLLRSNHAYKMAFWPSDGQHIDWHQLVKYLATALAPADPGSLLEY